MNGIVSEEIVGKEKHLSTISPGLIVSANQIINYLTCPDFSVGRHLDH